MSRPFQILPLVERTPAWWAWRRGGIGSSDAPAILGDKQAKSPEWLLLQKQADAVDPANTFVREQGARLERAARAHYCAAVALTVEPACVQNLARPRLRASLDGLSADGQRAVEIKCGLANYQRFVARGRPPAHHYAQLQHILAVTGLPAVDYWCFVPGRPGLRLEVPRDAAYIERLIAAEEAFLGRMIGWADGRTGGRRSLKAGD